MCYQKINSSLFFSRVFIVLIVILIFVTDVYSQIIKGKNLVPNPGFETQKTKTNGDIKNALPWNGVGTVDYYMKPEKRDTSKYRGAHKGTCYAGLRFQEDYKEYMWVKLTEPLERGSVYQFKMYVRMLEFKNVTVKIKQLGVYFSKEPFKVGMTFHEDGLIDSTNKKGIGDLSWILIQGDYTAQGGEQYIIIGNFRTKVKDDMVRKKKMELFKFQEAYYYLDDISLRKKIIPLDSAELAKEKEMYKLPVFPETLTDGQIIVMENVRFEKGTSIPTKQSYKIIDEYLDLLDQNPFMQVEIIGYTDNSENESASKKLSASRAKFIYQYFKDQEALNPMTYKGMGSEKPIASNDTEEGKDKNNRIEIVIIKQ